jgi:transposase
VPLVLLVQGGADGETRTPDSSRHDQSERADDAGAVGATSDDGARFGPRAQIVLACAAGQSNSDIAAALRITRQTAGRWRRRFVAKRLDGLIDEPRPGTPRRLSDAQVEQVITDTLEKRPRDATHWSTRTLAKELEISHATVGRIWRAFGLQPHRSETFKLAKVAGFCQRISNPGH